MLELERDARAAETAGGNAAQTAREDAAHRSNEPEKTARGAAAFGAGSDYWQRLRSLFTAVREGNRGWGVPAYGGAIFEVDAAPR